MSARTEDAGDRSATELTSVEGSSLTPALSSGSSPKSRGSSPEAAMERASDSSMLISSTC